MAVKLVALFKKPEDVKAFEAHYFQVHVPLAEKMPGLQKVEYNRAIGSPFGEPAYYMIAELTFESMDALNASMVSEEGKAAAKDLMGFAGNLVQLVFTETVNQPAEVH